MRPGTPIAFDATLDLSRQPPRPLDRPRRGRAEQYRFLYIERMKTTLDIDDDLLARAKAQSVRERKSVTRLIEEGLRLRLRTDKGRIRRARPALAIHRGKGGVIEGVDPRSNRSMLDAADDGA